MHTNQPQPLVLTVILVAVPTLEMLAFFGIVSASNQMLLAPGTIALLIGLLGECGMILAIPLPIVVVMMKSMGLVTWKWVVVILYCAVLVLIGMYVTSARQTWLGVGY